MKILLIEDESLAAEKLAGYVQRYDSNIQILDTLESVKSCMDWFQKNEMPDLILSDIELLDGNVFSFFQNLPAGKGGTKINCPIIFTTSYDEFLMKAFEGNGIAYLLKPFDFQQFTNAMKKYELLKNNFEKIDDDFFEKIKKNFSTSNEFKKRFAVKTPKGIFIVHVEDIAFVQVAEGLVFLQTKNSKKFTLNYSLSELEQILDPEVFFRINRSEIINVNFIEKLENYFNDRLSISLKNFDKKLISSASRTPALRKWIG